MTCRVLGARAVRSIASRVFFGRAPSPCSLSKLASVPSTLWDGVFHLTTYVFVFLGLIILWKRAHRTHVRWPGKLFAGTFLVGFGIFNVVEGLIDHHILGLHHVNETVRPEQWIYWDLGFLVWGALMLGVGWSLLKTGQEQTAEEQGIPQAAR